MQQGDEMTKQEVERCQGTRSRRCERRREAMRTNGMRGTHLGEEVSSTLGIPAATVAVFLCEGWWTLWLPRTQQTEFPSLTSPNVPDV